MMSEYQLFCYAESYGKEFTDSYQQKPYRVFNKEISEKEFNKIKIPRIKLDFDSEENYTTRYQTAFQKAWDILSVARRQEFYDIPHFNWDIFTKITGVKKILK
jgi:hypothetical protein